MKDCVVLVHWIMSFKEQDGPKHKASVRVYKSRFGMHVAFKSDSKYLVIKTAHADIESVMEAQAWIRATLDVASVHMQGEWKGKNA